jgi:hypothetical protein
MLSARAYYYSLIAPEEESRNYQRVHQYDLYADKLDDPEAVQIINHVPGRSNDRLIEKYIDELLSVTSRPIASRLENVFVAKRRNFLANAGAYHSSEKYDGDLVFFFVGLSDIYLQYSTLFCELLSLCTLRQKEPDDSPRVLSETTRLYRDLLRLSEAQIDWGISRNEIRFKHETVLIAEDDIEAKAIAIACLMDKTTLYHEFAHHILGHTGRTTEASYFLSGAVEKFLPPDVTPDHRRELEADLGALFLPLRVHDEPANSDLAIELALGFMLAQTVLAQLKSDVFVESSSHPSWAVRYRATMVAIRDVCRHAPLDTIVDDVSRFQALLYSTQKRGLGYFQRALLPSEHL